MISRIIVLCAVFMFFYGGVSAAGVENKGPEKITLDGRQSGVVDFPH